MIYEANLGSHLPAFLQCPVLSRWGGMTPVLAGMTVLEQHFCRPRIYSIYCSLVSPLQQLNRIRTAEGPSDPRSGEGGLENDTQFNPGSSKAAIIDGYGRMALRDPQFRYST